MRVLIVTDDYPPLDGGVASWAESVAEGLANAGHGVTVLCRSRSGLLSERVEVVGVRGPSFARRGAMYLAARAAPRLLDTDRILATTWNVATWLLPLARRMQIPLDVVVHGSDVTRSAPEARLQVLRGASRVFAVSRFLAEQVGRWGVSAEVIPAPVRAGPARIPSSDRLRWLFVGRATPNKGGDRFIRLVHAAGARGTLVGDGPELAAWRHLAEQLGADVRFTGRLDREALSWLRTEHDAAMLFPREDADGGAEGFGLVLVEGALAGLVPVGCATGGVPEALGKGICVTNPDDPEAAAAEIAARWTVDLGAVCRADALTRHGVERVVRRIVGA